MRILPRLLPLALALAGCVSVADRKLAEEALRIANPVSEATPQCPLESYNCLVCCKDVTVRTPETPEEVVQAVREAMAAHKPIHAVGHAHTGNPSICPAPNGVVISTEKLNGTIALEPYHGFQTVVVDAGVTMIELTEWLNQQHLSLGYHVLEFREATVGGAIGTAAHGSALDGSSVVADAVEAVWLVAPRDLAADPGRKEPREIHKSDHLIAQAHGLADPQTDDEWQALMTHLGMLGVVTRVRLRVAPQFNLRLTASYFCESKLLADFGVTDLLAGCDFGQINWFPRYGHLVRTCGVKTHDFAPPGSANTLLTPRATPSDIDTFKWFLANMAHARGNTCGSELLRYDQMWLHPPIGSRRANAITRVTQAIGPSHQMMSSELTKLERQMPQVDLEVAVPMSRATEILRFVNAEVDRLHLCFPLVGIFLRFTTRMNDSLLAHSALPGERGVMFVEFVLFHPGDAKLEPGDPYFGPYLALAGELIEKFHGRAHWAKNREELFDLQRKHDPDFADRVKRFHHVANELDPDHLFANPFSRALGLTD